ncbi:hypothetical protein ACO1O0_003793 [Amphichorda felina]
MKLSVLAFALGASASFTKVVRQDQPIATLDMYMNSACLGGEPYSTMEISNGVCNTFDAGYGSFEVLLNDDIDVANCMATLYDDKDCSGNIYWNKPGPCAVNQGEKAIWSVALTCINGTAPSNH